MCLGRSLPSEFEVAHGPDNEGLVARAAGLADVGLEEAAELYLAAEVALGPVVDEDQVRVLRVQPGPRPCRGAPVSRWPVVACKACECFADAAGQPPLRRRGRAGGGETCELGIVLHRLAGGVVEVALLLSIGLHGGGGSDKGVVVAERCGPPPLPPQCVP